jgi:gas vesicle protein GvpO
VAESTEPRRKRAEARERRRSRTRTDQDEQNGGLVEGNSGDAEQPLDSVKHAAKVAAAGAAVGAAAAAARVLTSRSGDDHEPDPDPEDQAEMPSKAQQEPQDAEADDEAEPGPGAEEEQEPQLQGSDDESEEERPADREHRRRDGIPGATPDDARATVQQAREQLEALLERPVESVSSFERTDDGWLVALEVVEVSRVPDSTDVLASYEMELDEDRNLRRYARVRRYQRSQADRVEQR